MIWKDNIIRSILEGNEPVVHITNELLYADAVYHHITFNRTGLWFDMDKSERVIWLRETVKAQEIDP